MCPIAFTAHTHTDTDKHRTVDTKPLNCYFTVCFHGMDTSAHGDSELWYYKGGFDCVAICFMVGRA